MHRTSPGLRRSPMITLLLSFSLLLAASQHAMAQPLVDKVPGESLIYVGWHGYDSKTPGFEGSHLKAVLDAGEFRKLIDVTMPALMEKISQQNKDSAEGIAVLKPLLTPMLKHETAIFIGKPVLAAGQEPQIKGGLICKAGADAGALQAHIENLMKEAPPKERERIKVTNADGVVTLTMGYGGALPAETMSASAKFKALQPHLVKDASCILYADIEGVLAAVDEGIAAYGEDPQLATNWAKVRDALGMKSVKRFVWTSGFDGKDWMDHVFVACPEPRTGLAAMMSTGPLSDAALKSVPMTATLAGASKFDVAKLVDALREAVVSIEPKSKEQIDKAFADASRAIGMDVQKDLLATLGDEWVYYVDPQTGGRGLGGIVILNRLKDAAKAEQAFTKLETLVNDVVRQNIKEKNFELKFRTTKSGDTTIHYLGSPIISPAWAIKDGHLMIGLFPQIVAGAAEQIGAEKSILDNPAFQALRTRLGVEKPQEIVFLDLPKTAPDSYATWVAVSRLVNFADLLGAEAPAMLLPPLAKLMPHLAPAGSVTWMDKDGLHVKAISPFPGATLLASDPMGGMQMMAPALMGVGLPAAAKAREQAQRAQSQNNLRQLGLTGAMYASDPKNKNAFPETLADVYAFSNGDLPLMVFQNPRKQQPAPRAPADKDAAAKWIEANADYVWLGKGLKATDSAETVLAYEKPEGLTDGINVLFADGHTEWMRLDVARERINKQQQDKGGKLQ